MNDYICFIFYLLTTIRRANKYYFINNKEKPLSSKEKFFIKSHF